MIPSPDVVSHKPKQLVATDTHRDKGDSEGYCDKTTARHADQSISLTTRKGLYATKGRNGLIHDHRHEISQKNLLVFKMKTSGVLRVWRVLGRI